MDQINPRASVQNISLENDALRFQVPFAMSITGPQQSINVYEIFCDFDCETFSIYSRNLSI
jgi:hypothetical protein